MKYLYKKLSKIRSKYKTKSKLNQSLVKIVQNKVEFYTVRPKTTRWFGKICQIRVYELSSSCLTHPQFWWPIQRLKNLQMRGRIWPNLDLKNQTILKKVHWLILPWANLSNGSIPDKKIPKIRLLKIRLWLKTFFTHLQMHHVWKVFIKSALKLFFCANKI